MPIVVVGITPHQGKRESRLQGEVAQVIGCNRNREVREMRTAETVLNIRRETALPFRVEITGERRDTETVMRRSEGGDWKSASKGNSLVAYPTASTVL